MTRWLSLLLAAVTGLVVGALVTVSLQSPAVELPVAGAASPRPVPVASPGEAPELLPPPVPEAGVLLVWTAGGLPAGLADLVRDLPGVTGLTTVAAGNLDLARSETADGRAVDVPAPGWVVPLDTFAIDAETYAEFVTGADHASVAALAPGTALLGATSAELRRLTAGDRVTLSDGTVLRIAGVVDDTAVGAAELVVTTAQGAALGVRGERFLLVEHDGDRAVVEDAIRAAVDVPVRVRGPGETPYLRHGDAVLPQALVKAAFGEFAYRPATSGREIAQDTRWQEEHVVSVEVPVLGRVRCHRNIVKQLAGALAELETRGLAHLVDPDDYEGCHHPRLVAPGGSLSRHAWGIALDLNAGENPTGAASTQDPRLVETFTRWGFTWGGFWLVPDAMHVEWVGPPTPAAAKAIAP